MQAAERHSEIGNLHQPVLLAETLHYLNADAPMDAPRLFIDCTLGLGGHSERILEISPLHHVLAFDRDAEAIDLARTRLARSGRLWPSSHFAASVASSAA